MICPFPLIAHYCRPDRLQSCSSVVVETKASINQSVCPSVCGCSPPASAPPTCLADSCIYTAAVTHTSTRHTHTHTLQGFHNLLTVAELLTSLTHVNITFIASSPTAVALTRRQTSKARQAARERAPRAGCYDICKDLRAPAERQPKEPRLESELIPIRSVAPWLEENLVDGQRSDEINSFLWVSGGRGSACGSRVWLKPSGNQVKDLLGLLVLVGACPLSPG